jgi:alkylation response protein AidB-like acyl-CoA dehydrogenase
VTPEAYLGRVRSLLPALRERAARAEKLRRLPDDTFADFQEAGLFRALQPKRYGGYEIDPGIFYQAVTEVGAVCVWRSSIRGRRRMSGARTTAVNCRPRWPRPVLSKGLMAAFV